MKSIKKIFAVIIAMTMALMLALPAFADAATTYTITINDTTAGHTYEAYQVFTGTLAEGVLSDATWGTGVKGDEMVAALIADPTIGDKFTAEMTASDVANAMDAVLSDSDEAKAFAKVIGSKLSTTVAGSATVAASDDHCAITGLAAGYYLVKDADDSLDDSKEAYTRFILQVVKNVAVTPKTSVPSVEKKVQENVKAVEGVPAIGEPLERYNDVADWNIGDEVPFMLTGTLPTNYADYDTYNYVFHDTACEGLDINNDIKVYVRNGDEKAEITAGFTTVIAADKHSMTVTFADLKTATTTATISATSRIAVEYTATLNKSAEIGRPGNPNDVYLTFSNNPNEGGDGHTGTTPHDKVIVFTYELDVNKYKADTTERLKDAKFKLYSDEACANEIKLALDTAAPHYVVDAAGTATITSTEDAAITIKGLDAGTYYLKETEAPAGYSKLAAPIKLEIAATTANNQTGNYEGMTPANAGAVALTSLTLEVNTAPAISGDVAAGKVSTDVENHKGPQLPSTGGMGTTLFTILGIALMAGAAVLLVAKRRTNK